MLTWDNRYLLIFQSIYDVISIFDASFKLHPHEHASLRWQPAGQPLQILQRTTWKQSHMNTKPSGQVWLLRLLHEAAGIIPDSLAFAMRRADRQSQVST
ncbi:MAG: hypothetical protein FRX49_02120 [Trebouxia sp. A1-2]|nr:MAG: hypothetical protein FRX49_02120 [Trebouxia sp. A1-2]